VRAQEAISTGILPEALCPCPSCTASSDRTQLQWANEHNLWHWTTLRSELATLTSEQRLARFASRLANAQETLRELRAAMPAASSLRHLITLERTFNQLHAEGVLDTQARIQRAA
jgi:hypothetical protein